MADILTLNQLNRALFLVFAEALVQFPGMTDGNDFIAVAVVDDYWGFLDAGYLQQVVEAIGVEDLGVG